MNTLIAKKTSCYHVAVLSNFARGFDKYQRRYSKDFIPESTFKDKFYLLDKSELAIGYKKAGNLLSRLQIKGDRLLVIETEVQPNELNPNLKTGLGRYVNRNWIQVKRLFFVTESGDLKTVETEEAIALSFQCMDETLLDYDLLIPRTVSVLPVAQGCQAKCPFCFSSASVSKDIEKGVLDHKRVKEVFQIARSRGAERAVITGGGEPGVLNKSSLLDLISISASEFNKVVMITNGFHLGRLEESERIETLMAMKDEGLTVLAISRHHFKNERNADIMHLHTLSERVAQTWNANKTTLAGLKLRWICVLQEGGIENKVSLQNYLDWAESTGVEEVCFKELYVSSSVESEYYTEGANQWSRSHQVPLTLVMDAAESWGKLGELPWGAPIYQVPGKKLKVAVYTEPSLYWEKSRGICRSWNLMADGRCLASLEDQASRIL